MSSDSSSRSAVWKYFKKESAGIAQCLVCSKKIHNKGNTSNLHSHLKYKHPNKQLELKKYSTLCEEEEFASSSGTDLQSGDLRQVYKIFCNNI